MKRQNSEVNGNKSFPALTF